MIKVSRMAASVVLALGALCLPAHAASAHTVSVSPAADLADGSPCEPHGALLPDPNDPTIFFHCAWGVAYMKKCPDPLHFNPVLAVCDWPENADNPVARTRSDVS
ncbi:chitin-binding domain-containing protein [Streptomyces sp. NPDC058612]|uniref:chitin-binding domain-containing protein n=1 Tax=Streptomyces sp. NPDC058612 TaxID=3346555 RepID=UPI0036570F0E